MGNLFHFFYSMKKLILILLLCAALAVAWLYWQPAEPTNAPASVSNVVKPAPQVTQPSEEDKDDSEKDDQETDVVIDVTGVNFSFSTETIEVNQGDVVTINFESTEGFHDWVVDEFAAATDQVNPGTPTSVTFVADQA